jgi:hypothetical protein
MFELPIAYPKFLDKLELQLLKRLDSVEQLV